MTEYRTLLSNFIKKSTTVGLLKNDGTVDTTDYVSTSNTEGLIKNDGTIDTTSYLSAHQDITGKEDKSNKVTSISSSSTNTQYPSAKAVDTYVTNAIKPKEITANSDLNDYTEAGFYYCGGNATSQTLTNNPTYSAFSLLVEKNGVGNGVKQTYTTFNTDNHRTYVRIMYTDDWTDPSNPSDVWGSWQLYFQDTGWQNISFSRGYQNYSSSTPVRYRRIGKIVHLEGKFKNNSAKNVGQNGEVFGNITDSTCLPTYEQHSLQQGSGANKFLLAIQPSGQLYWGRYGTTSISTQADAGAWLHCYATWFVD